MVERRAFSRRDRGSKPPAAVSKFRSPPLCLCLSEETLKTVGPFYMVSMPGEVTYQRRREMKKNVMDPRERRTLLKTFHVVVHIVTVVRSDVTW